jgi:hypothetical protein
VTFPDDLDEIGSRLQRVNQLAREKTFEFAAKLKSCKREGRDPRLDPEVLAAHVEMTQLHAEGSALAAKLQQALGLSDERLRELDLAQAPPIEHRYDRADLVDVPSTDELEPFVERGLAALRAKVDRAWLREESAKRWQLEITRPLVLFHGRRIDGGERQPAARLARMLLLGDAFLERRSDFDHFQGASLIPELAALGLATEALPVLGAEARKKFDALASRTDSQMAQDVYELLVGAAFVRMGKRTEMLRPGAEEGPRYPDLRVHDQGVPLVAECKRRFDLNAFELREIEAATRLFGELRREPWAAGLAGTLEVTFTRPLSAVDVAAFVECARDARHAPASRPWGDARYVPIDDVGALVRRAVPSALDAAFGWPEEPLDWDGLVCVGMDQRDPSTPFALKWRTVLEPIPPAQARGVGSLIAEGTMQVPYGEMGVLYVAYEEGAPIRLADARTKHLQETCDKFWHEGGVVIPLVVVDRLYPRAVGDGRVDFVESAVLLQSADAHPDIFTEVPTLTYLPSGGRRRASP